ncbi:MAG TPA: hypothetical protein VFU26_09685 [Gaiellaceae bacterium]|nr:hypothetical protein [Gaiellaceae bacterium]
MWELVWLMLIMKIPILYLGWVVYWAIKSEPRPEQPATLLTRGDDGDPSVWRPRRRPGRLGPHGRPTRGYARTRRATVRT